MKAAENISTVILAGGQARRLGGVDKGLVELCGKPLITHIMEALYPQVVNIIISANRHQEVYAKLQPQAVIISDDTAEYAGPLAGILSALRICQTPLMLVVPCDAPLLPADLAMRLQKTYYLKHSDICVAHDGERLQPLFALLRCDLLKDLAYWLQSGQRKVLDWYQTQKMSVVDFSDVPEAFINLNTWETLKQLETQLQKEEFS